MLAASTNIFRIQFSNLLFSFGPSVHEKIPGVSQSLRSFFPRNILDKWNPQHAACPCDCQSVWGNRVKHTLDCTIICQVKLNVILYFFPKIFMYALCTELQSISCWPTECVILLPTSHFKMTTLATSTKFVYFRLLLRNSKIASSKTVTHPRMETSGIEHWTVQEPILCLRNHPECFDCAYIFETFETEGLYPDGLVEMVPDSSETPDFLPVVMQWLCTKMLTLMNLLI